MNKKKLYWICQIGGWLFFVLLNSLIIKLSNAFNANVAISMFLLFFLGVTISHLFRNLIIKYGWIKIKLFQLIPRVVFATILMAAIADYAQYGIEFVLNISSNKHQDVITIITNILNLVPEFFSWSLIYFQT